MLSTVLSEATPGIDAYIVEVETNLDLRLPAFSTVGLPDGAMKESKYRVMAARECEGSGVRNERV